ncbi:8-oxoguanine glycosylase OGG1 KNAG_0E03950 [Huiozyma naganishii CBS 8797]|uniref:DNA-(apurinic or apyrimidinic site) lyase n=1 Tax=Huiozyma naganishii (strain ATCC MYA-139 / BCRC 22969 / CBS 8797 / KCTC 17520 / NBRC 10181 / NCYC 3082 / Yp74L-3) TaxID=1071383 RepID=J7RM79_HUIN7|nr:hypothetical protein KNAG_0E03950 [Kazachstania naganishii CBS 8797]CCK70648.1 hypothetical protein KNAG_0E03950 [Kazachstania naganishii CBS 8797]
MAAQVTAFKRLEYNVCGELLLKNVLQVGQAFRWILEEETGHYYTTMMIPTISVSSGIVILRQTDDSVVEYAYSHEKWTSEQVERHLFSYFRLDIRLLEVHEKEWKLTDPNFAHVSTQGVRILAQEPWETLVSFICSSNNNISRITKMCHGLAENFGTQVGKYCGTVLYSFPTSEQILENGTEDQLRKLGFGYRAKYIMETAKAVVAEKKKHGLDYDYQLLEQMTTRGQSYEMSREYLMQFTGVGPKVADCVCLMGLRMDHVVPVDVHIGRIAKRDYNITATKKELAELKSEYNNLPITRKKVNLELDHIRRQLFEKWGTYAGWAQGILFFKEVGSTNGSTSEGKIKKRKLEKTTEVTPIDDKTFLKLKVAKVEA